MTTSSNDDVGGRARGTGSEQEYHLLALLGIENPLVMKSPFLRISFPEMVENRLCMFSFLPATLRRFLRSCSSSRTLAVNIAVAAFLIPFGTGAVIGVDVPLSIALLGTSCGVDVRDAGFGSGFEAGRSEEDSTSLDAVTSSFPFFFRFLEPGAFLSECVRFCSAKFWARAISRSLSTSLTGRMGMTFSVLYGSLHYEDQSVSGFIS